MKLEQRCSSLTDAFRKADKSNTGFISPADFEDLMRDFNIRLTRQALAALVAKYDANVFAHRRLRPLSSSAAAHGLLRSWQGDGFVSYQEFAAVMTGVASEGLRSAPRIAGPADAVQRAEEMFRRAVYQEHRSLTAAFLKLDRDRSGFCSPAELARVFQNANVDVPEPILQAMVEQYDTNNDGRVDIREVCAECRRASASILITAQTPPTHAAMCGAACGAQLSKLLHTKGAPYEPPSARGQKRVRA
jgi:Ca2+-binding EF-hand superfamily protein